MTKNYTHYPDYDVLNLIKEWDPLTADVVLKRLGPFPGPKFLNKDEQAKLRIIGQHLIYDNRDNILNWIIHFFDQQLTRGIGEYQRKPQTPPEKILIREGLKAIDNLAQKIYNENFLAITTKEQFALLAALQQGKAIMIPEWSTIPQKELFNKLLVLTVSAYYSHPTIWSKIGYGGPAYPRGYYRIEFGLTDPWEAERNDSWVKEDINGGI